ncbi:MAG: hypothetical protein IJK81_00395 [Selenomonadaceae bacterium]|nr:hypothetical protein [Selenomonadaceae bacterium]
MSFKDAIYADLDIFVETDEFAELIEIDGVQLPAQVLKHTEEKSQRLQEQFDGLHGDFVTIYFKSEPFITERGKLPQKGDWILIDNRRYDVVFSQEELGIIKVVASAYRQPTPRLGDLRRI